MKLFAGRRVTPGSPAPSPGEAGGKINSTNNLKKESVSMETRLSKVGRKRDEECIWSGVAHEGAAVMCLPVVKEVFDLFT